MRIAIATTVLLVLGEVFLSIDLLVCTAVVCLAVAAMVYLLPARLVVSRLQTDRVRFFAGGARPRVAITFDDGPDPGKTEQILAVLARHGARASFFVVGERVEQHPELARAIVGQGHLLCNHHWRDERTTSLSAGDMAAGMRKTHELILRHQPRVRYFRPGAGFYNDQLKRIAAEHGYTIVLGDVYPHDVLFGHWPRLIVPYLVRQTRAGSIIILHDKARLPTETTLALLLERLSQRGFSFCTLDELFEHDDVGRS